MSIMKFIYLTFFFDKTKRVLICGRLKILFMYQFKQKRLLKERKNRFLQPPTENNKLLWNMFIKIKTNNKMLIEFAQISLNAICKLNKFSVQNALRHGKKGVLMYQAVP